MDDNHGHKIHQNANMFGTQLSGVRSQKTSTTYARRKRQPGQHRGDTIQNRDYQPRMEDVHRKSDGQLENIWRHDHGTTRTEGIRHHDRSTIKEKEYSADDSTRVAADTK